MSAPAVTDWTERSLGDLTTMESGGTPSSKVPKYYGGGVPWVSIADMTSSAKYVRKTTRTLSSEGLGASAAKLYEPDVVLYAMYASLGECAIAVGRVSSSQAILGIHVGAQLDRDYLYYYLNSIKSQVLKIGQQGTQSNLNAGMVRGFRIPLPPILEQRRISMALSATDDLIFALDRMVAKKQAIKQGMMQQLLTGKTRLPGFTKQWVPTKLGAVASMGSGGTPLSSVPGYYGGGIPWVSISDMTRGGKYIAQTETTLAEEGLAASAAKLYEPNVVLYAMYASLGECSLAVGRVSSSQAILGIRTGPNLCREFLYYWLQYLKPRVKSLGQQGTQSNLNAGMVRDFDLLLPGVEEQVAVGAALADADAELAALERRLAKARAIKTGMMQELLTGRTRLPVKAAI